jgi:hypothetical protein
VSALELSWGMTVASMDCIDGLGAPEFLDQARQRRLQYLMIVLNWPAGSSFG